MMLPPTDQSERRQHLRIQKKLALEIESRRWGLQAESVNLSSNGVYCITKRQIPLMTRLKIVIALPDDETQADTNMVECSGIVVRADASQDTASQNDGYRIAVQVERFLGKQCAEILFIKALQPPQAYPWLC
jgi:hypothetical protein